MAKRKTIKWNRQDLRKIYAALQSLVEYEDKNMPFTDSEIAQLLQVKGFEVSANRIWYYRQRCGIEAYYERRSQNERVGATATTS